MQLNFYGNTYEINPVTGRPAFVAGYHYSSTHWLSGARRGKQVLQDACSRLPNNFKNKAKTVPSAA